ncbi:MAG: hypothetical protein WAW85_04850 [Gordonia sp. (in: high G+C Gram-positive bacteria)]|uniref:hypothetical protein n=1 Tax=Gordonia sp. (in: high G+C Gram-positive bacteria) TaxID=84139 RepID=UPI003BB54429
MKSLITLLLAVAVTAQLGVAAAAQAAPESVPFPQTLGECRAVGLVGASLSDRYFTPKVVGSRTQLEAGLRATGKPVRFSASAGRSTFKPGTGTDRQHGGGLEVVKKMRARGVDCFLITFGTNDAAQAKGDRAELRRRIELVMAAAGPSSKVDWVAPQTAGRGTGGFSDRSMAAMRRELVEADRRHQNLDVNHWERVQKDSPAFWAPDQVHLWGGRGVYAEYVVRSLHINGSR